MVLIKKHTGAVKHKAPTDSHKKATRKGARESEEDGDAAAAAAAGAAAAAAASNSTSFMPKCEPEFVCHDEHTSDSFAYAGDN